MLARTHFILIAYYSMSANVISYYPPHCRTCGPSRGKGGEGGSGREGGPGAEGGKVYLKKAVYENFNNSFSPSLLGEAARETPVRRGTRGTRDQKEKRVNLNVPGMAKVVFNRVLIAGEPPIPSGPISETIFKKRKNSFLYLLAFPSAREIASAVKGDQKTWLVTCIGYCRDINVHLEANRFFL